MKKPNIMQQVQLIVGGMVLIGVVLAWLVSPWALLLCGFMGVGLLRAGLTGVCPMETMLTKMPWNKAGKSAACGCGHNDCGA